MKLYYSPTSPYVRKVSVTAAELGIELERETVAVHDLKDSSYGKVNPINRIPALRRDDGSMVFDSKVICEFLDSTKGHKLLPAGGEDRWEVLRLEVMGDGILDAAVPRMAERNRPKAQQNADRLAEYERSVRQTLDALEDEVTRLYDLNLGSITVACALGYLDFRFADEDWHAGHPKLAAWYDDFVKRPSMQATMPPNQPPR